MKRYYVLQIKRYYVLQIWEDVEPILHGPYETEDERDARALLLRARDDGDFKHGLYPAETDEHGALRIDSYSGAFFDILDEEVLP